MVLIATLLGRWLDNTYPFAVPGHYVAVVCLNPVTPATTDYGVAVSLRRVDGVVATPSDQEVIAALAASRRVPVADVAVQIVAFGATADNIVSEASREIVVPSSTRDEVVAAKAVDKVVPTPSLQGVCTVCADDVVRPVIPSAGRRQGNPTCLQQGQHDHAQQ